MTGYLAPTLSGLLILVVLWDMRAKRAFQSNEQIRHMNRSRELLQAHKKALEQFLASESAPDDLKRLLINHSDSMSDRELVGSLARVLVSRSRAEVTSDDNEIVRQIQSLRGSSPDLSSCFARSIVTGTFAAVLRWPETAVFFEEISATMAADPKRDVEMAVTASHFQKSKLPFGVPDRSAAMA